MFEKPFEKSSIVHSEVRFIDECRCRKYKVDLQLINRVPKSAKPYQFKISFNQLFEYRKLSAIFRPTGLEFWSVPHSLFM
jgi:hypothetical protein